MFAKEFWANAFYAVRYWAKIGADVAGIYNPPRYFANRYFAPRYFIKGASVGVPGGGFPSAQPDTRRRRRKCE